MINNKPKYLINLDLLQKYHFMLFDLDTCLNKSSFICSFEINTNSLQHVSNCNQRGKFDLNWRREREGMLKAREYLGRGVCKWKAKGLCSLKFAWNLEESTKVNHPFKLDTCINLEILAQERVESRGAAGSRNLESMRLNKIYMQAKRFTTIKQ